MWLCCGNMGCIRGICLSKVSLALISCNNHNFLLTLFISSLHPFICPSSHPNVHLPPIQPAIHMLRLKKKKKTTWKTTKQEVSSHLCFSDPLLLSAEMTTVTNFLFVLPKVLPIQAHRAYSRSCNIQRVSNISCELSILVHLICPHFP